MIEFKVQSDIKNEFLETKPTGTAQSMTFILRLADDYEDTIGKSIYNMSHSELREMVAMQFKNTSTRTIAKNLSILRKYIDFCIDKGLVSHMENRLATFTIEEAGNFVNLQALKYRYTSPEQLKEYQVKLINYQDKAILEAAYQGIRGRTQKDATCEEIINLQIDEKSVDFKNNRLILQKNNGEIRVIQVSDNTMDLFYRAQQDEEYIGNNGEETTNVKVPIKKNYVNKVGNYVFRVPGKNKYDLFNPVMLNSRMHRIQGYVGNKYLTINSLYFSGMITMAKQMLAEKGSLEIEDYIKICERYDYGSGDPTRYVYNLKDLVQQYLALEW